MRSCPRCLGPADHSPDEKQCSDNCIVRYRQELDAALAEIERLTAELEVARLQIEVAHLMSKSPGTYRE